MIYLDNASTTKMFEEVADVMRFYSCESFFNASAGYSAALKNAKALDEVRQVILNRLKAKSGDVIFTSGATESNNLAVCGSLRNGNYEYVFSAGEHPSVYNVALHLKEQGRIVKFVPLTKDGQVDYDALEKMLNDKTRLISIMHVNNETGVINNIAKISEIRDRVAPQALIHVDGVQGFCKIPFDLGKISVDFYTISAHKFHGPKGVGALYVKNRQGLKPIVFGGGQEGTLRSGTENLPAILGMKCAIEKIDVAQNLEQAKRLKDAFLSVVLKEKGVTAISGESPYILCLHFPYVNGETLMRALEDRVIISTGSACSSKHAGNRVLQEMGRSVDFIKSCVRVSFNAYLTEGEVKKSAEEVLKAYKNLVEKVK